MFLRISALSWAALSLSEAPVDSRVSRRTFLKATGLAGVASLSFDRGLGLLASELQVEPFSVPLSIPPVLKPVRTEGGRDYYELKMKPRDSIPTTMSTSLSA